MPSFKSFTIAASTVGTPFNGAVSGVSVTISGTTVRGTGSLSGRVLTPGVGNGVYAPLEKRSAILDADRTIKHSLISAPTLPTTLPFTVHLLTQRFAQITYTTNTASSFSAVTISSTTVRPTGSQAGAVLPLGYSPYMTDTPNYGRQNLNYWIELQIFGAINHRLFMDY